MKSTTSKGADMKDATMTPQYEIGSREWKLAFFAADVRRHADGVDDFADTIEAWGWNPTARTALGLIERGEKLTRAAERIYENLPTGQSTKASYRNDAGIALGVSNNVSPRSRGAIAYATMYALGEVEKVADGTYLDVPLRQSRTAVKASSLRVHASSCRVIAGMIERLAAGEIRSIG